MSQNTNLQISYLTIRRALGILGMALPLILWLGTQMAGPQGVRVSISSYYFTNARDIFVGLLCALALFLFSYKGYDWLDDLASSAAGFFALLVAWFPACGESREDALYLFRFLDNDTVTLIHYLAAGLFFATLAAMSAFLFTKTGGKPLGEHKKARNRVYRGCAIAIAASLAAMGLVKLVPEGHPFLAWQPTFWLEALALVAFGISWLVKGKTLLRDKPKAPAKAAA